jgi:DNA (cytosine-5)-methyltransferase 1
MIGAQFILPIANELIIDLFAGGGGASTGIELAVGRHVDIAVNHDRQAVSLHEANHPQTKHFCSDVFEVDPLAVTDGQPVGLLWASPDCKHFSKAKGGKPVSKKIRGLAWVVIKWAKLVRPRVICLENVEEFKTWGPLNADNMPCPERKGQTFQRWKKQLENLGYVVETRELRACDYGAPTIRKRLFLVARRDGQPIVWPAATHGKGLKPYRTAADCIDWSLPCPSIFERTKPLAEATQRRIAHGIKRYVIDSAKPFIVPVTHPGDARVHSIDEPFRTITGANRGELALAAPTIARIGQTGGQGKYSNRVDEPVTTITSKAEHLLVSSTLIDAAHGDVSPSGVKRWGKGYRQVEEPLQTVTAGGGNAALASATLIQTGYGERPGQAPRVPGLHKPLGTAVDGQKHAVVSAFLAKHYTGVVGSEVAEPIGTVTSVDHHSLVAAHMTKFRGDSAGSAADAPLHTVTSNSFIKRPGGAAPLGVVTSHLAKLRGTSTSADSAEPLGTVSAQGQHHALVASHLVGAGGPEYSGKPAPVDAPMGTVTTENHRAEVRALLMKYYGTDQDPQLGEPLHTVTTKDRFGLVTVDCVDYYIADIGMRMLQPRELYRAQGFPDSYVIDRGADGAPLPKDAQVRMCGNSVCPPLAQAIVAANYMEAGAVRRAA